MAGIREIANEAGVSISTVSYALNGSDKISEATRVRIQKIAKAKGYAPKLAARTLKGNKTNIVGVYIPSYQGEFYGELLDGMQQKLDQLGYDMMVNSGKRPRKFLSEKLFDGAIVLDHGFTDKDLMQVLDAGRKVVVLDREISHKNARMVLVNNKQGSKEAAEHLLSEKQEEYYIISGPQDSFDANQRIEMAQSIFKNAGIEAKICQGDFTESSGYDAAREIFSQKPDSSKAVYALNDNMAIGFYRYAQEHDIDISGKIKLVGFDNNHAVDFFNPTFPSVSYRKHFWGERAAQTLVDLIENKAEVNNTTISTQLHFRGQ
ncbi:LacI family DNA-binding transcriptional regulator [Lactococcus petauri]|uniref:LacI family DNA-binding transcriptional regulator n=1 Tax=Lactococcus petauri TaxID=1940789 RepID=UPI00254D5854|nr:LacI family DNA-binding transcriptional regulator [Lactococcus petauri]